MKLSHLFIIPHLILLCILFGADLPNLAIKILCAFYLIGSIIQLIIDADKKQN
jgi:hypothetical protein